ncbi:MAG: hypothetical protein NTV21_12750 [Planctomycetota bacterium]|nr:hypothetical protein [Planctomycetota bacterium]
MKLAALPASLALLLASCAAPQFQAEVLYGPLDPSGDVAITDTSLIVPIKAKESVADLGINDQEATLGARADLKWGSPHLTLTTQQTSWSGDGTIDADFGGISVPGASLAVSSDLDLAVHRALLTFDLFPTDLFELGIGFGLTAVDIDASVAERGNPTNRESVDELLPIPVLAGRVAGRLGGFELEGLASGLTAKVNGDEATYVELDLNAKYAFVGEHGSLHGAVVLGWRSIDFKFDYTDGSQEYDINLGFDGPYVGLQFGL